MTGFSRQRFASVASSYGLAQFVLFALAYGVYSTVRWLGTGEYNVAVANAHKLVSLQSTFGLNFEKDVQDALLNSGWMTILNVVYVGAQFVVLPLLVVGVYRASKPVYRQLRNTLIATWLLAMPLYALIPTAPPRFANLGFVDTVADQTSSASNSDFSQLFYNPFAAMPSLHASFAFALGIAAIFAWRKNRWVWPLGVTWGPLVALATVATGNHYVLDVLAGLIAVAIGFFAGRAAAPVVARVVPGAPAPAIAGAQAPGD